MLEIYTKKIGQNNLTIVIPTFNRKDLLRNLLSQLISLARLVNCFHVEIVVVVDGSTDGTIDMLKNEFPYVHIVCGDGNWWYTKCMNEGFKYAIKNSHPDFILSLNDDIELPDNYLLSIYNAYEKLDKESIIGSISLTYELPHRVTFSGIKKINKVFLNLSRYHDNFQEVDVNSLSGTYPSEVLPGRGMFIPIAIAKKLNFLDETFPQYHSDFDFCLRAREQGIKIYVSWNSVIYSHHKSTSSSTSYLGGGMQSLIKSYFNKYSRRYLKSEIIFYLRHGIPILLPIFLASSLLLDIKNVFIQNRRKVIKTFSFLWG